ncbi:putative serine/threonine protein kinase [Cucurbitaria berberidis CBS 394.84]|uniref:Serine/threonine protein kinase n=1 Tax=Cucurbitaria berberidis CBS 394.84 TaxID=1168544 RepID=A0A9P4GIN3_9PLEO|nr:putative serine/threonine protein kinase [Cucurbitaria berberidis CBS 394.84]KAF1846888.1 putative serine/threonine protein kinase [Cucurbitaria berberidis CBS 394.84]
MSLFPIGRVLKGKIGTYTITKEIQETVWFAKNQAQRTVVIKSVQDHPRVENERNVLKRFQDRTRYLRPLVDEIEDPATPITIALRYLESDLLDASIKRTLDRKEIKHVSRCILEALQVLHEDGYVHTDVKPDNVFVNLQEGDIRFSDVQLGDLGGCYHVDSEWATSGTLVGAPIWSSPEVIMEMPWNTASDIWSFGAVMITLIYGGNFNIFRPKGVDRDHEDYLLEVVKEQFRFFGPFPAKFEEIASRETIDSILYLMQEIPKDKTTPFSRITEKEVIKKDKDFIGKMMKLDWRDRPTAKELLRDEWWKEGED